jgi:hypothetical protein
VLENRSDFDDGFPVGCQSLCETAKQQLAASMLEMESSEKEERLLRHALFANPRYCRAHAELPLCKLAVDLASTDNIVDVLALCSV